MIDSQEIENLKLMLTSPRPRRPGTLTSYISIARQFLDFLGEKLPPDEMDLRRFFVHRRESGIGEGTLRTTYAVLKKLYRANRWEWPLDKEDLPEEPSEIDTPAFTREEFEELIRNREKYSTGECFYLAIATIYAPRREELAKIKKRDIKGNTIFIDTVKKGEKRTHLIPDEIMPYIEAYHPRENNVSTLSALFHRICIKGLGKDMKGYGWHSFRRTLDTVLPGALARADKPLTLVGYFFRWNRKSIGTKYLGTPMAGVYSRPDVLSSDPFFVDREVFEVHPFIRLWLNDGDNEP